MTHERMAEHLPDFARGELAPELRSRVSAHVEECEECRDWLATHQMLEDAVLGREPESAATAHPTADRLTRFALDPASLPTADAEALSLHLEECADCAEEADLCRRAVAAARPEVESLRPAEPSPARERRVAWWAPRAPALRWATAAGILAVVAVAALLVGVRGGEELDLYVLTEETFEGVRVFEAEEIDVARSRVAAGAEVTLRAETVALGEGFYVGDSARLTIESSTQLTESLEKPEEENS